MTDLFQPVPLPVASVEFRKRLAERRSAPAQSLIAPGPSDAELDDILQLAARSPDHGKLVPWRFVVLGPQSRKEIAEQLAAMAERRSMDKKAQAVLAKLTAAPLTVMVVSRPVQDSKPVWEQQLSAGAVCMNLEHAAGGYGYSASWITDWYSYDTEAMQLFGLSGDETIAGFIHLGSLAEPPMERPRPDMKTIVTRLP